MNTKDEIVESFKILSSKGYLSFNNNYSAGINLERTLGMSGDCFNIPDYKDYEIKTMHFNTKFNEIELFSCRPDGPYAFSTKVIAETYDYPDKDYKQIKVIKGTINGEKKTKIGLFYYFKIDVDYDKNRVLLNVYDTNKNYIATEAFWDFDSLIEKLNRKMQNVALFYYRSYKKDSINYYWYYKLEIYKLNNLVSLITLIEDGIVTISLKCGVNKSGKYKGTFKDRGSSFRISKDNLEKLFIKEKF